MASDYVDAFMSLADAWTGNVEQSQKSLLPAFQNA